MNYQELFTESDHNCVNKWSHYFEIYDDVFRDVKKNPKVLEIGVQNGGSLQVLSKYFGKKSEIYGLDIDQRCASLKLKETNIWIAIGDASQKKTCEDFPVFDLIIDDGSHDPNHQRASMEHLFLNHLSDGGIYLIEDLEHSFKQESKSILSPNNQSCGFIKDIQEQVYLLQKKQIEQPKNEIAKQIWKIINYSGIVCFYKGKPRVQQIVWSKGPRPIA